MPQVDRFSVSLDTELLAAFDRHIAARGYGNRSEAVRDMIRDLLMSSRLRRGDEEVVATLTVACDHRVGGAAQRLRSHVAADPYVTTESLHLALGRDRDLVVLALRGPAGRVQALADQIQATRGITHGHLAVVPVQE